MGYRQDIKDLISQYIVSNNKQWITGEQMNLILNDFATKIKFFKDENSVEPTKFNGMRSFLSDYKFFEVNERFINSGVTDSGEMIFASSRQSNFTDCLDYDLRFYDPFYFSNVTLEEAKSIVQLQAAIDLLIACNRQPEMKDTLIVYFQQMGDIKINSPYTRAAYIFYASQLFSITAQQPEIGSVLASFYLNLIFPPIRVIQTPIEQVCRLILVAEALRNIARQPESLPQIIQVLDRFGGITHLDNPMVNVTRNYVVGVLLESIARQPEVASTLKEFFITYAGAKILFKTIEFQYADGVIMSAFLTSAARQPEIQNTLIEVVNELTNLNLTPLPSADN